ncbi:MAG: Protein-disulfide reductase [Daejeonella sp.]|nr:Protein-disulfide reductase [Daejeonella sp.]
MKKLLIIVFLFLAASAQSQILEPVKWSFSAERVTDKEATLVFKAKIEKGWHVYSQQLVEDGPIPTSFKFTPANFYTLIGKTSEEPRPETAFDKNFNKQISWHENLAIFKQKVKLNKPGVNIEGVLEYMVCNDHQCLPPTEVNFKIPVQATIRKEIPEAVAKTSALQDSFQTATPAVLKDTTLTTKDSTASTAEQTKITDKPINESSDTLLGIFILGFFGGLAAFFMPCIYPMIPLTVSFFTKKSGTRRKGIQSAVIYGLSIIVIYVALGLLITVIFGASALNEAASSATFNLLFFALLIIFAMSFLGAFEITLPSGLVNKMDEKSNNNGFVGLFFMAFTLALVSFSCTGPIIGGLLVQAVSKGSYLGPAIGMLGFSSALAIPFTLFAIFPSWLKEMPRSGGWMNTVKVSLGFLELALAFKFLSNVDLAYHWQILNRDIYLIVWIVVFGVWGFYLLGKIKFSHDSEINSLSLPRMFISMFILGFTIYLIPGLFGAPLKPLSGWLPPPSTQDFNLSKLTNGARNSQQSSAEKQTKAKKYATLFDSPQGIDGFFDYEEGMEYAIKVNKPVLLDFTGHSCANCRRMEESVWSDPEVLHRIKEDFVLISLYVDDKTDLDENDKYISTFSGKSIKNIGQKWSDFQASTFKTNSQPYYVILNHNGDILGKPEAFNLDIGNYIQFLDKGKEAFGH